jgi:hypothetical protein
MPNSNNKQFATKKNAGPIWSEDGWTVRHGKLVPRPGRPHKVKSLLRWVGEKIPFAALSEVKKLVQEKERVLEGVYVAHDSMGFARYVGRGRVFDRLKSRLKARSRELAYFSFYIVANKKHEREIETLLIRLGGANLHFNERKKRVDIEPGQVTDYESGTRYVERQRKRGRSISKPRNPDKE